MSSLNGRGGIRTHGGFPHARFRVECLKPDSATLPIARHCRSYFRMRNFRVGCLYPTHTQTALQALRTAQSALVKRVRGLKANASPLPPEDLDRLKCSDLDSRRIDMRAGVQSRYSGWLVWNRRALHRGSGEGGGRSRRIGRLGAEKCYNFRLAIGGRRAAYCMSQGQPTLLLVVHLDSQVVCAAVHKYSHIIENFNPPSSP